MSTSSSLDDSATARRRRTAGDDLSAIAWVQEELRRSLDAAHKSLRRFIEGPRGASPAPISTASIPACCAPRARRSTRASARSSWSACRPRRMVLRASEAAVQRSIAKPQTLTPRARRPTSSARRSRCSTTWRACSPASTVSLAVAVPAVPRGAGSGRGRARPSGRPVGDATGAGARSRTIRTSRRTRADADVRTPDRRRICCG